MKLDFKQTALDDLIFLIKNDKKKAIKIIELLKAIEKTPFAGIGKPEPLKFHMTGYWSRRIDDEHRLIYRFFDETIEVLSCRYHY